MFGKVNLSKQHLITNECTRKSSWRQRSCCFLLVLLIGLRVVTVSSSAEHVHSRHHLHIKLHEKKAHHREAQSLQPGNDRGEPTGASHHVAEPAAKHAGEETEGEDDEPWPLVYMYKLPRLFTDASTFGLSLIYMADVFFPWWLTGNGYTTDDPEKADLYLPLMYLYHAGEAYIKRHGGNLQTMVEDAQRLIAGQHPYWNRSGGVDHIWVFTEDHGFCGFAGNGDMNARVVQPSIILSHWGHMDVEHVCDLHEMMTDMKCMKQRFPDRMPCFVPVKDTVIPTSTLDFFEPDAVPPAANDLDPLRPRKHVLFQSGGTLFDVVWYSHGVRQHMFKLFRNHTGFKLVDTNNGETTDNYFLDFQESIFCLAPTGTGWGVRTKIALYNGCIPVVLSDGVQYPLEDVLPWGEFALRLPQYMLYRLPEALQLIMDDKARLESMQKKAACVWRYFSWQKPFGRAGEAVICSLRRKLAGWDVLKPTMDWDTCKLQCDVPKHLRRRRLQEMRERSRQVGPQEEGTDNARRQSHP
eukprot:jgi/Botrbrau1/2275/Bobra.101_2s0098.1